MEAATKLRSEAEAVRGGDRASVLHDDKETASSTMGV